MGPQTSHNAIVMLTQLYGNLLDQQQKELQKVLVDKEQLSKKIQVLHQENEDKGKKLRKLDKLIPILEEDLKLLRTNNEAFAYTVTTQESKIEKLELKLKEKSENNFDKFQKEQLSKLEDYLSKHYTCIRVIFIKFRELINSELKLSSEYHVESHIRDFNELIDQVFSWIENRDSRIKLLNENHQNSVNYAKELELRLETKADFEDKYQQLNDVIKNINHSGLNNDKLKNLQNSNLEKKAILDKVIDLFEINIDMNKADYDLDDLNKIANDLIETQKYITGFCEHFVAIDESYLNVLKINEELQEKYESLIKINEDLRKEVDSKVQIRSHTIEDLIENQLQQMDSNMMRLGFLDKCRKVVELNVANVKKKLTRAEIEEMEVDELGR